MQSPILNETTSERAKQNAVPIKAIRDVRSSTPAQVLAGEGRGCFLRTSTFTAAAKLSSALRI